jgi:hypothetical protein
VERLDTWRRKLGLGGGRKSSAVRPAFVELRSATFESVEVVLRSGRVLRVAESISAAALKRLVEVLEEMPGC